MSWMGTTLKIEIIRGQNQIGGSVIKLSTDQTSILLDAGKEISDIPNHEVLEDLVNESDLDAILISHYHEDHIGLVMDQSLKTPVFMGNEAFAIIEESLRYKGKQGIQHVSYYEHNKSFIIGDMTITPYLCDHSAFDSYMFLIESENKRVLYTGDFRSNGRKVFSDLLTCLPGFVDVLIIEGTMLSRPQGNNKTETQIEEEARRVISNTKGPVFILMSSMNIDRLVSFYRAMNKTNRLFLQDLYMAMITRSIGGRVPNPSNFDKVHVFVTRGYDDGHFRRTMFSQFGLKRIGKERISKAPFVMCVRGSMGNYLLKLSQLISFKDGVLFYSMWNGYKAKPDMKMFLDECSRLGLSIIDLHTSGHADVGTIKCLIDKVNPKAILPVHTENAIWYNTQCSGKIPVISDKETNI
jgi:ribonuclease J